MLSFIDHFFNILCNLRMFDSLLVVHNGDNLSLDVLAEDGAGELTGFLEEPYFRGILDGRGVSKSSTHVYLQGEGEGRKRRGRRRGGERGQ